MPLKDATTGIDAMKFQKDYIELQPSDAVLDSVYQLLATTQTDVIAHAVPWDSNADFVTFGNTPSPRTVENFFKVCADKIHAVGKRVRYRGTLCGIEGIYDFTHLVGGNRISPGSFASVIGGTFYDNFNRGSIGGSYVYGQNNGGGTDAGNVWTIDGSKITSPAANGWRRSLLTSASLTNVTATVKVKYNGNAELRVRAAQDANSPGYGFQLRGSSFVLERSGLAQLATTAFTPTTNAWYWIKAEASGTTIRGKIWAADDTTYPTSTDGHENEPTSGLPAGAWHLSVTDGTYSSGRVGVSTESNFIVFDDLTYTLPGGDTSSLLGKYYVDLQRYLPGGSHACIQDGDILASMPERTENIFNDVTSFLTHSGDLKANYANFFNEKKLIEDYACAAAGLTGVVTGRSAQNWTEVTNWIPGSVFANIGVIPVDHYGKASATPALSSSSSGTFLQTYTLPTTLSEASTAKCTWNPEKVGRGYSIKVWVVNKGTGDLTLTLHNASNGYAPVLTPATLVNTGVATSVTIPNASITNGAYNEFQITFDAEWDQPYHFHLTSTVGDATVATNTAGDLSTLKFQYFVSATTADSLEIDIRKIHAAHGLPVDWQEFGDHWNGGLSQVDRTAYLISIYDMIGRLVDDGVLTDFTYWEASVTGTVETLLSAQNPAAFRFNGEILKSYYIRTLRNRRLNQRTKRIR